MTAYVDLIVANHARSPDALPALVSTSNRQSWRVDSTVVEG
jgi:hypothetical protein